MQPLNGELLRQAQEPEVQAAMTALRRAVTGETGFTAALEAQVQNSIQKLRSNSPYAEAVKALETVAVSLTVIAAAKRTGRCNLHDSQVTRLRRQLLA
jgi:hypothetical protein